MIARGLGSPIFIALEQDIFKTEIFTAGGMAVALALVADGLLVLVQRALTPWVRARMIGASVTRSSTRSVHGRPSVTCSS